MLRLARGGFDVFQVRFQVFIGFIAMIRNLSIQDLSELAELRVALPDDAAGNGHLRTTIQQLFRRLLFDTPGFDPNLPSLVSTDANGRLNGMLAVGARPLSFEGRSIAAAIGADLFVPEKSRSTMAGVALLKGLFNGSQDVTISDNANATTRRLWERLGGFVASGYNLNWVGVLRPVQLAGSMLCDRPWLSLAGRASLATAPWFDRIVPQRLKCSIDPVGRGIAEETLTTTEFSEHIQELTQDDSVQPVYSQESTEWMWKRLPYFQPNRTEVSAIVLRNSRGHLLGWYIYQLSGGGVARVAQIAARQANVAVVVNHLFAHVFDAGGCAVAGRLQPRFQQALIDQGCVFRGRSMYTLVHSRDEKIARAFRNGSAWLSVLEGEAPFNAWNSPEKANAELGSLARYSRSLGVVDS